MCEVNPFVIYKEDNPDPNSVKDPHNGNFYYSQLNKNLYIYMCKWIQINLNQSLASIGSLTVVVNNNPVYYGDILFNALFINTGADPIAINSVDVWCSSFSKSQVDTTPRLPISLNRWQPAYTSIKINGGLDNYHFRFSTNMGNIETDCLVYKYG